MKIKSIFIYVFCLFANLSAHAFDMTLAMQRKTATDTIERFLKNKNPQTLRQAQRDIIKFNNILIYGQKDGTSSDKSNRLNLEAEIDYYTDECARNKSSKGLCGSAASMLATYKKEYNTTYTPKAPNYPQVDLDKQTYTLNGKTYDLKNNKYVTTAPKASTSPAKVAASAPTTVSATTTVSKTATASETAKETKAATDKEKDESYNCEWDTSLPPRKLLYAPGCSGSGKVCSGFVKCTKNGFKINRLATCGSDFCSDATATECAKQRGYGSKTVTADGQAVPNSNSGSGNKQNSGKGVN